MILKIKKLREDAVIPEIAHPGDAGIDLRACVDKKHGKPILARSRAIIPTGIAVQLPAGTELQVRPRSGLALMHGITVLNTPGTIDEGYRGEVGVILINHSREMFRITNGMKIAQACLKRVEIFDIEEVEELSETSRGEGGFGSTGI
jgi:dUTP pyrophosphatase